jgi:polysaccharide deacetylase 2 family uncharacterized protein YibQ
MGFTRIFSWFFMALLGGIAAIAGQRLFLDSPQIQIPNSAHRNQIDAPLEKARARTPKKKVVHTLIHPDEGRGLVLQALAATGLRMQAIHQGRYPLRGVGRKPSDTMPLVSFTCPAPHGCEALMATIERRLAPAGLSLVRPKKKDQVGRPVFRAVARGPNPILALRAYPPSPRLTVVVADVGTEPGVLDAMLTLDEDVTYAFSVNAPHAKAVAARLVESGREFIAHLPMEPTDPKATDGPAFLTRKMTTAEVQDRTQRFLDIMPRAVGADGHLGGAFAGSSKHIGAVLEVLANRGLYFLDQRPSDASVATATAKALGVRSAARTHRLESGKGAIDAKLRAVEVALVLEGQALVVAEGSPDVLTALRSWLSDLRRRKIHLIRLSEIVL